MAQSRKLKRISVLPLAAVFALFSFFASIFCMVLNWQVAYFSVGFIIGSIQVKTGIDLVSVFGAMGTWILVFVPAISVIFSFLIGLISGVIVNFSLEIVGGLELEFEES